MATLYTEIPDNFSELSEYVITERNEIVKQIFEKERCFFYDTCSLRYHANLENEIVRHLFEYIKQKNGIVIVTRCILMELASLSKVLNKEYVDYIKAMKKSGVDVLVIYEEDLFDVMDVCFGTNAAINSYLTWAVRMIKTPVSTISETFLDNPLLQAEVIGGKNADRKDVFRRFFSAVRQNKKQGDNLGEELLAICLHMLSYIPGEKDEKFAVITDDKGAAGKIDHLFKQTNVQYRGQHILIFSRPKLIQYMYGEGFLTEKSDVEAFLKAGNNGHVVILGSRSYDLRSEEISISCHELTELLFTPNKIHIVY